MLTNKLFKFIYLLGISFIFSTLTNSSEKCNEYRDMRGTKFCLEENQKSNYLKYLPLDEITIEKEGEKTERQLNLNDKDQEHDEKISEDENDYDAEVDKTEDLVKEEKSKGYQIYIPDLRASVLIGQSHFADASNQAILTARVIIESNVYQKFSVYLSGIFPITSITISQYQYINVALGANYYYFYWESFLFFVGADLGFSKINKQYGDPATSITGELRTGVLLMGDVFHLVAAVAYHRSSYSSQSNNFNLSGFIYELGFGSIF